MKEKRQKITPRFTGEQKKIINSLVGPIGGSPSEVVSRIVFMWLMEKGYIKPKGASK